MTRDEIRALIGGYATGSLTDAERSALFEAALDDQELFEELAREQTLKDVIDQPGARERLIRSLETEHAVAWWKRPWPWAAATAVAVAAVAIFLYKPVHPTEVARLGPQQVQPRVEKARETPAERPSPKPAPMREAIPHRKTKSQTQRSVGGLVNPEISAQNDVRMEKEAAAAGASAAPAGPPITPAPFLPEPAAPQTSRNGVFARLSARSFGFHYAIDWNGDAIITANADGYLTLFASRSDTQSRFFPEDADAAHVLAGSTTRVPVPSAITAMVIEFSATPPDPSVPPVPSRQTKELNGAIADPAPSPDSKLVIRIAK